MDFCYQELNQLAAERRARLDESRRLWKFFWEMAEEVIFVHFIITITQQFNVFICSSFSYSLIIYITSLLT